MPPSIVMIAMTRTPLLFLCGLRTHRTISDSMDRRERRRKKKTTTTTTMTLGKIMTIVILRMKRIWVMYRRMAYLMYHRASRWTTTRIQTPWSFNSPVRYASLYRGPSVARPVGTFSVFRALFTCWLTSFTNYSHAIRCIRQVYRQQGSCPVCDETGDTAQLRRLYLSV
jgi:hypothetical protein